MQLGCADRVVVKRDCAGGLSCWKVSLMARRWRKKVERYMAAFEYGMA